jgi:hypothetical protein
MVRRFTVEGREWDVEATDISHSVGLGASVGQPASFGVGFKPVGGEPGDEIFGRLTTSDLTAPTDDELRSALRRAKNGRDDSPDFA